jgi:hypothetical protein
MAHRQDDYLVVFRLYALSSRRPTILASIGVGLLSETPFTKQSKWNLLRAQRGRTNITGRIVMAGTLFANVRIIDGSGAEPFTGHVLVEGNRIKSVGRERPAVARGAWAIFLSSNNSLPPETANVVALGRAVDIARARDNEVMIVRADVAGRSADRVSFGSSALVDACGTLLRAGETLSEDMLVAEVHAAWWRPFRPRRS